MDLRILLPNAVPKEPTMKIFLEFLDGPVSGKCAVTGKPVSYENGLGFCADKKTTKPVSLEAALEEGFFMDKKTFKKLETLVSEGTKYEEVQQSAHREFDDIQE
jgi:hypothetical protein